MKKNYETPSVEVVKFQYSDQVVASSGTGPQCDYIYINIKGDTGECTEPKLWREKN